MLKIVLDTNNFISSQINKKGPSAEIFSLWEKGVIQILTSNFQLAELKRVLSYFRIQKKYKLSKFTIEKIITLIRKQAEIVYPLETPKIIVTDIDDNQILAIAKEGNADYLISGDQHLLALKKYRQTKILPAAEFVELSK
ncbi:MAG: putative toxin-antitoxin system toxin component, PIN family [Candidatus Cloacimonetes bacterium]|nr:putative toxin-antitoxin system toxin component, PIN family [Candidatus Cloacimonadota bacterium]